MSGREAARRDFSIARILIRAIQGHIGRNLIEPGMLGHVAVLFDWQQILFHRGCSFSLKLILEAVLIAGRKESREGRQILFFTPLHPCDMR